MKCHFCGAEEAIPFKCRYCSLDFCHNHRLPVNHECPFAKDYREQPKRSREFLEQVRGESGSSSQKISALLRNAIILRFSGIEILHLLLGTGLVMAVGLSFYDYRFTAEFLAIFISAFVVHELAHKFLAQFYNAWAEFRVELYGAIITAVSALPIMPFKFIAPGAVYIGGHLSQERYGRVSLIGPVTNLVMGFGFLAAHYAMPQIPYLLAGASFNGWIALFNMLPFGGLDGQKIFSWSKVTWGVTIGLAVLLFLAGRLIRGGGFFGLGF